MARRRNSLVAAAAEPFESTAAGALSLRSTREPASAAPSSSALPPPVPSAARPPPLVSALALEPYLVESASPLPWLYESHTLTGLALALCLVTYLGFFVSAPPEGADADGLVVARRSLATVALLFLIYCSIQLRDSLLARPHPAVWRVVHGVGILYLLLLAALVVAPVEVARSAARLVQPQLEAARGQHGDNVRIFARDCRLLTLDDAAGNPVARFWAVLWDDFVVAHAAGWFVKALLIRDWRLGLILSVLWEVLEYSFSGVLANFYECWWDHWVIDVACCNLLGFYLGMRTVAYLELRSFDWAGVKDVISNTNPEGAGSSSRLQPAPSLRPPSGLALLQKRLRKQLRPRSFEHYEWRLFDSARGLFAALGLVALMETIELNAFFLKFALHLPTSSPINIARLLVWSALSFPAVHEYYAFATSSSERMGPNIWLAIGCAVLECMLVAKGLFGSSGALPPTAHFPPNVVLCWAAASAAFTAWCLFKFWAPLRERASPRLLNGLLALMAVAFAVLVATQDVFLGIGGEEPEANLTLAPMAGTNTTAVP